MEHHHEYTCPMHPEVIKPQPGKCPKCGMDLVPVEPKENKNENDHSFHHAHNHDEHAAHDKHAGHHTEDFLKRFWFCLGLTIPVLMLSEMVQHWFGFHISFPGDKYLLLLLGSIIYIYGGMITK